MCGSSYYLLKWIHAFALLYIYNFLINHAVASLEIGKASWLRAQAHANCSFFLTGLIVATRFIGPLKSSLCCFAKESFLEAKLLLCSYDYF